MDEIDISAPEYLKRGLAHMESRAEQRDEPGGERSMGKTIAAFNALHSTELTEEQGWMFMVLLKQARASCGVFVSDDYEDGAAYFALAGEAAGRERKARE